MTLDEYDKFAAAIRAGGCFTNGVRPVGQVDQCLYQTVVSRYGPKILGGNSFWVTRFHQEWYFGTWGVRHYVCPEPPGPVVVSLEWLKREPNKTLPDFDHSLVSEFGLIPLSIEEFERRAFQAGWVHTDDDA